VSWPRKKPFEDFISSTRPSSQAKITANGIESIEAAAQQAEKQQMNEIFLQLSEEFSAVHNQPIPLAVILAWLEGRVEEIKSSNGSRN
jgi:hypothetical protein